MSRLPRQMCQTVMRVRQVASGENPDGTPILSAVSEAITGCLLAPLQGSPFSESQGADFDRIVMTWKLTTPPGVDLVTSDRIQQGQNPLLPVSDTNPVAADLEVYGAPAYWPGPDGNSHHVEAMLKKYGG